MSARKPLMLASPTRLGVSFRLGIAVLMGLLLGRVATPLAACNIPVFRYALENWQPDPYHVLAVSADGLTKAEQRIVQQLRQMVDDRPVNAHVQAVDLSRDLSGDTDATSSENGQSTQTGSSPAPSDAVPNWVLRHLAPALRQLASDAPQLVVLYPRQLNRFAWHAPLTDNNVKRLIDSPLRQEIANRLLDGHSAVWVLVECDDPSRNDAAWRRLNEHLDRIQDVVQLPARELIVAEDQYRAEVEEKIELRVEFSAVRLARDDMSEAAFASLLRGSESDLVEFADQPLAVPIYGRGRTYFALVGKGINAETIETNGRFICGACSCEIKRENPGVDLLMAVDWDSKITGSAMPDVVLPELTGIGGLELTSVPAESRQGRVGSASSTDSAVTGSAVTGSAVTGSAVAGSAVAGSAPSANGASGSQHATGRNVALPAADATTGSQRPTPGDKDEAEQTVSTRDQRNDDGASDDADATGSFGRDLSDNTPDAEVTPAPLGGRLLIALFGGVGVAVCALGLISYWIGKRAD